MIPRRLSARLQLTFVTLIVLGLGGVIAWSSVRFTAQGIERSRRSLVLQAQLVANALREPVEESEHERSSGRTLNALLASYAQGINGRATLVDTRFAVLASSDTRVPARAVENQSEFAAAQSGSPQAIIRWDEWRKEERLFVAAPVVGDHDRALGFVQLSVPAEPLYAEARETWVSALLIGGIVLALAVAASTLIARQIAVPVQNLTRTSEQIAAGRLDERVTPAGPDEIQRLGIAFNRMAERVQAMIAQQRAFVDNAAHELRSPLTSLRLRIEMLQTRAQGNAELTARYLGQMEREVGYLQRLVDHLLALASVENEARVAPRAALDLARLLREVADEMRAVTEQAGLAVQLELPAQLPILHASPEQMHILFRNLVDNAIKYTPRGGTITLAAHATPNELIVRVSDTGIGIPAQALPHIFERFYRVDPARARSQGGAGLGLALVHEIVQAHGGTVAATSRVNAGTVLTIRLPL